jgi:fused signal recognition particle receptor
VAVPQAAPEPPQPEAAAIPRLLPSAEHIEAVVLRRPPVAAPAPAEETPAEQAQPAPAAAPAVPQVAPAPELADIPSTPPVEDERLDEIEARHTEEPAPPRSEPAPEPFTETPAEERATAPSEETRPAEEPNDTEPAPTSTAKEAPTESEPAPAAPPPRSEPAAAPRVSWFQRLRHGLSRSSSQITGQITGIFTKRKLDEDTLQDLEDVLIQADLGVETAMRVTDALASGRYGKNIETAEVSAILAGEIEKVLAPVARPLELDLSHKPHVVLVVGVNGTGKTTTIGKLAAKLSAGGMKVTLAAGDTFRAAAIEQLKIWGERTGSEVVASKLGADAAGLAYDASSAPVRTARMC